jgi:ATP-dependent DNA ligase
MALPLSPARLHPMEAASAESLPKGRWQYEPKWDGFRCLVFKDGASVQLMAKSGKPLTPYFPEMVAAFAGLKGRFILDGELVIPVGGMLSFDALQLRLHPALSRRTKLAAETPAIFIAFDIPAEGSRSLIDKPLTTRRAALEKLFARFGGAARIRLSPRTTSLAAAKKWLDQAGRGALDGVIAKPLDGAYAPGAREMVKVKKLKSADCVVGGFRYATGSKLVGSLLLGLYDGEGKLDHVGFTSNFGDEDKRALTKRLEALKGGPGFTGNAPGGPSRWSTERSSEWVPLKTKLVVEVRYDHVTGGRFRHGTKFLRWRPDKAPRSCTMEQLAPPVMMLEKVFG